MKKFLLILLLNMLCWVNGYCNIEQLVILGSGPAGLTAALFAGQSHLKPLVIEGKECEGQLSIIYKIENYPGFPEGISGTELIARLRQQAEIFGARFQPSYVVDIDLENRPMRLSMEDGQEIFCHSLIIAPGTSPKWLGLESEKALIGKGISASATCDAELFEQKEVIVVGGGDSAMEQALLLAEHASKVTVFYNKDKFYASSYLQERVLNHPKITACYHAQVVEVLGVDKGYVTGVIMKDLHTNEITNFQCEGIFISNGRQPNTGMFKGKLEMNEGGYVLTKPDSTLTSIPGVFAAGDITQSPYRKVVTATASGCMSAIDAARYLKDSN